MAFKAEMRSVLQTMALKDPQRLREILNEDEYQQLFLNALKTRMMRESDAALKLYAQCVGALDGAKNSVSVSITGDLEREAVAVAMDAMGMSDEERFEACLSYVEKALLDRPERRMPVLDRLGGRFVESSETLALAALANGGGDGGVERG